MARQFDEDETFYINEMIKMLGEALEMMGSDMVDDIVTRCENSTKEEMLAYLGGLRRNVYTLIKEYPPKLETEYEEFRNHPDTIAAVEEMMTGLQIEFTQGEGNDDEGNGNLQ
jgi:hypothetical protein